VHYANYTVVYYEPAQFNAEGCAHNTQDQALAFDWTSSENIKLQFASALSAHMAGKTVNFGVAGGGGSTTNFPQVYRFQIDN